MCPLCCWQSSSSSAQAMSWVRTDLMHKSGHSNNHMCYSATGLRFCKTHAVQTHASSLWQAAFCFKACCARCINPKPEVGRPKAWNLCQAAKHSQVTQHLISLVNKASCHHLQWRLAVLACLASTSLPCHSYIQSQCSVSASS